MKHTMSTEMINRPPKRALLRYFSFLVLIALVGLRTGVYAEILDCYGSSIRHCETDPVTVCTSPNVSTDPNEYYCNQDGADTCEDYCGGWGVSETSSCLGDEPEFNGQVWCSDEWYVSCDCMDI